jgi:ferritin-like metal-binding protein YciE
MQSAKELFTHELGDILDAENRILGIIDETLEQTQNPMMEKALQQHRKQTEQQIQRLEQCFEVLGEEPEETECKGIMGLKEEKEEFMEEEEPSEEVLEAFNIGAAIKVEHYEIAAYTSLVGMAQKLGITKAARLLSQNLKEEQQMLKKCEAVEKKFKPTATGMSEEEEGEMAAAGSRSNSRSRSSRSSGSRSNSRSGTSRSKSRKAA